MWTENKVYKEDLDYIINDKSIRWEKYRNSRVLVSGATGMIGSSVVNALVYANMKLGLGISIYAMVRNVSKAENMFSEQLKSGCGLELICGDVLEPLDSDIKFDYIIHTASPTLGAYMIQHPLDVIKAGVSGTLNLIETAVKSGSRGFVFLSSMEIYGEVNEEKLLSESDLGYVDLRNVRNCYQETKRTGEMICLSAAKEYGLRTVSVRLAQTFGAGVSHDDGRVFAMMARCAENGEDIVLKTKGESRRPYLYTAQAVSAILCALTEGEAGKSYNAANPSTYCSVYEMGQLVAKELTGGKIKVVIDESGDNSNYPKASFWKLDTSEIEKLGWKSSGTLMDMYRRMMDSFKA